MPKLLTISCVSEHLNGESCRGKPMNQRANDVAIVISNDSRVSETVTNGVSW